MDLAVRISDLEKRNKCLNTSIGNIRKDLSEVLIDAQRTTIKKGLDEKTFIQVDKILKEIFSLKQKLAYQDNHFDDVKKILMQKEHEINSFKDITDSLHKTVAIIEDRNNEKVEKKKQYT
jgi:hypothetical protein